MSTAFRRPFLTRHGQFSIVILYTTLQGVYMVVDGSIGCQLLCYDFLYAHVDHCYHVSCVLSEFHGEYGTHGMFCM